MRMHIDMDEALVAEIDALAGHRGRSSFVREAVQAALAQRRRAELVKAGRGRIADQGHGWDADAARWVRDQRRTDRQRVG